jgi:hypothetical protein
MFGLTLVVAACAPGSDGATITDAMKAVSVMKPVAHRDRRGRPSNTRPAETTRPPPITPRVRSESGFLSLKSDPSTG